MLKIYDVIILYQKCNLVVIEHLGVHLKILFHQKISHYLIIQVQDVLQLMERKQYM